MYIDIIVSVLVALCVLIGFIGIIVPAVPGTGLIFLGIFGYAWYFGFDTVGRGALSALGIAVALSFLFDYLGQAYGAKRFGSTRWGIAGSVVGGIVGVIVFNVIGLIVGIFLGAALAEALFARRDMRQSFRIGFGSVLGFLGGTILNVLLGLVMITVFLVKIIF